jgi:amino acid adenylation domain-containing protein
MRDTNFIENQFSDSGHPAEKQLSVDFNPGKKYPVDRTIHELFEEQAERTPHRIAAVGKEEIVGAQHAVLFPMGHISVTYKELNKRSNQLARRLREKGVKPGVIVGVLVVRSVEMIVGILAILKAGGAYLPLDPKSPHTRKRYMLKDSGAQLLLTHEGFGEAIESLCEVIDLEDEHLYKSGGEKLKHDTCTIKSTFRDLAYVIYTSGSTGNPKGVPITHGNLCPLLYWGYEHLPLTPADRSLQNLSYYFDWSVWEIFIALTSGSSLYMTSEEVLLDPETCTAYMSRNDITVLHITPTQFQLLISSGQKLETLKYLAIGAEKLTVDLVKRSIAAVNEDCRVYNMYGPTEATIMSAVLDIDRGEIDKYRELSSVPIGNPIANSGLLVLDRQLNLCPVNVYGGLYIWGDGLAAGYLNDPLKSLDSFMGGIFEEITGGSLYRTGDLVRWLADGTVEFLGRIDHQIKIRGIRIEPGEIENQLLTCEKVKDAAVIAREDNKGEKYLCAYIVPACEDLDVSGLREELSGQLPDYMVPSYFVLLERIPLNPNGKIDRKALPGPEISVGKAIAPPETGMEKKLVEIWAEVLQMDKNVIGTGSDFFELGGHSIKAFQVISRIRKELNIEIGLMGFFHEPTIAGLAKAKAAQEGKIAIEQKVIPQPEQEYYELSHLQGSLWLHSLMEEEGILYNNSLAYTMEGNLNKKAFERAFQTVISRHEILRTCFIIVEGQPKQKVNRELVVDIAYLDFRGKADMDREKSVKEKVIGELRISFDLREGPLLKAALMRLEESKYVFLVTIHHLIFDGWSTAVFMSELLDIYTAICKGTENTLKRLNIQYRDYAIWQDNRLSGEHVTTYKNYWLQQLKGNTPGLDLLIGTPRPTVRNFEGEGLEFEIDRETLEKLSGLSKKANITLFTTLITALYVLLHKYSGQVDIIIGVDVAGRTHKELEGLIGHFVNMLPIRITADENETFPELLQRVKHIVLGGYDHQEYPFNLMVSELGIERSVNRSPLFDVNISWEIEDYSYLENDFLTVKPCPPTFIKTHFDLCFNFREVKNNGKNESKISALLSYCTDLFDRETIELMRLRFLALLKNISQNPESRTADLEFKMEMEMEMEKEYQDSIEIDFDF